MLQLNAGEHMLIVLNKSTQNKEQTAWQHAINDWPENRRPTLFYLIYLFLLISLSNDVKQNVCWRRYALNKYNNNSIWITETILLAIQRK